MEPPLTESQRPVAPVHTMKRTGRLPWASQSSRAASTTLLSAVARKDDASTLQKHKDDTHRSTAPAIADQNNGAATPASTPAPVPTVTPVPLPIPIAGQKSLSSTSKIAALQKEWERNKLMAEKSRRASDGSLSVPATKSTSPPPGSAEEVIRERQAGARAQTTPSSGTGASGDEQKPRLSGSGQRMVETPVPLPIPIAQRLSKNSPLSPAPRQEPDIEETNAISREQATAQAIAEAQRFHDQSILHHKQRMQKMVSTIPKATHARLSLPAPAVASAPVSASVSSPRFLTPSQLAELARKEFLETGGSGVSGVSDSDSTVTDEEPREGFLSATKSAKVSHAYLESDANGDSYYSLLESDGTRLHTFGAPMPQGHVRATNLPNTPFICPVRNCRTLFPTIKGLCNHFHGRHNAVLFNDNGDGTFSQTGTYVKRKGERSPGIIVSQNPLPRDAPSPSIPSYSLHVRKEMESNANNHTLPEKRVPRPAATPSRLVSAAESNKRSLHLEGGSVARDQDPKRPRLSVNSAPSNTPQVASRAGKIITSPAMQYLHSLISPRQEVPDREDIRALARFKQVRKLPEVWIQFHRNHILEPLSYACALAYVVGDALPGRKACKRRSHRLSEVCVVLPAGMSDQEKSAFSKTPSCLSCRYHQIIHKQTNDCLWGQMQQWQALSASEEPEEDTLKEIAPQSRRAAVDRIPGMSPGVNPGETEAVSSEPESVTESRADFVLRSESESVSDVEPDERESVSQLDLAPEPKPKARKLRRARERHKQRSSRVPAPAQGSEERNMLAQLPFMEPQMLVEMEEWEVAPGRVKSESTNENTGFSSTYLTTGQPVRVSPDVSLNVTLIRPGSTHHWPVQSSQLRTCFVGSGKLTVKIDGQSFKIGTHGAFIVRPNQKCSVENKMYIGATVCCSTFEDYELATA